MNVTGIVQLLKKEQDRLTEELRGIGVAFAAFGKAYGTGTGTRKCQRRAGADGGCTKSTLGKSSGNGGRCPEWKADTVGSCS